ncbi:F-box/kelch-repeat protein At3g06240-like [Malus domestica]|uniref:F-box/kelch-repeat protein At3g06240-like n=1 Tax=Malus domestica TaxID=3750 RepID=UPI000498A469
MAHNLPEEIIHDILYRLPPKSLIICTSVCKPWNSMIKIPNFIRTHLNRTIDLNNQFGTHLLLVYCDRMVKHFSNTNGDIEEELLEGHYNLHYDNLAFDEYCKLEFPIVPKEELFNNVLKVVGICNGLVLLEDCKFFSGNTAMLCNPSTRKSVTLPKPHYPFKGDGGYYDYIGFGFGFDAVTNDYKVVRITVDEWDDLSVSYEVYSLAAGSWSDPCSLDHISGLERTCQTAFVNGALHWLAFKRLTYGGSEDFILAFDVGSGSFRRIMTPENLRSLCGEYLYISGYGKSIALSKPHYSNIGEPCLDIWVMKEYGVEESWTKATLCPAGPQRGVSYLPSCSRKSGDVVLKPIDGYWNDDERYGLACVDLVSKQLKSLGIHGYGHFYVESYVESLVLLDKKDAVSY